MDADICKNILLKNSIKANELGKKLATKNIELVYGGANVGLMETVANEALSVGEKVIGDPKKRFVAQTKPKRPAFSDLFIFLSRASKFVTSAK